MKAWGRSTMGKVNGTTSEIGYPVPCAVCKHYYAIPAHSQKGNFQL